MSRRTRIKFRRTREKFGMIHHAEYSSSDSYFPRSYSILGQEILFPISVLDFYDDDKINFTGTVK
jgi:hypothetical protein